MPRSDGRPTAPRGTLLPRGSDAAAFTAWGAALTVGPAGLPAGGCDRQAEWDDQGRGGQPVVPDPLQHALDVAARPLRALPCIPRRTAVRPPAPPPPRRRSGSLPPNAVCYGGVAAGSAAGAPGGSNRLKHCAVRAGIGRTRLHGIGGSRTVSLRGSPRKYRIH